MITSAHATNRHKYDYTHAHTHIYIYNCVCVCARVRACVCVESTDAHAFHTQPKSTCIEICDRMTFLLNCNILPLF
jgi:hypothetical protein